LRERRMKLEREQSSPKKKRERKQRKKAGARKGTAHEKNFTDSLIYRLQT
jgi:hypothetical protein